VSPSIISALLIGIGVLVAGFLAILSESAFRSVVSKARTTIAGLRSQLRVARDQIQAIGTDIADWAANLASHDRDHVRRLLSQPNGGAILTDAVLDRMRAEGELSEIYRVWLTPTNDTQTWENRCVDQLGKAIPYLFPEFKPKSKLFLRKSAKNFLRDAFDLTDDYFEKATKVRSDGGLYKLVCNPDMRPDLCGLFELDTSYSVALREQRDVILIVEAKNPDEEVDEWVIEEAFSYAYDIYRLVRSDKPIHFACIAVAGLLKDNLVAPAGRLEGFGPASIRMTATTWGDLYEKALRSSRVHRHPLPIVV
jgi:hypothetical protein